MNDFFVLLAVPAEFYSLLLDRGPALTVWWTVAPFCLHFLICRRAKGYRWAVPALLTVLALLMVLILVGEGGYHNYGPLRIACYFLGALMWPVHAALAAAVGGLAARLAEKRAHK